MKNINFYKKVLGCNDEEEIFKYLVDNLKKSILTWSYFVNWEKVFENTKKIELGLNVLNYLIGKKYFDQEFNFLIKQHPEVIRIIPAILAVRNGSKGSELNILVDYQNKRFVYEDYDFNKIELIEEDINKYLLFIDKTGLKDLLSSQKIKNLVDYVVGVEVGLDSNGRKNRCGSHMEKIVEYFIKDFCERNNLKYLRQANADVVSENWNIVIPVDKNNRRYDFAIYDGKNVMIFETNFYGAQGTKIKSTAGEYRALYDLLKEKCKFIWITDGTGWKKSISSLRETYDHNDYIFNLDMIEKGVLNFLLP